MELNDIFEFQASPLIKDKLREFGFTKVFSKNEVVLKEDAYVKAVPIVSKGSVKVIRTDEDGREILLYYLKPGESCIMSLLGGMHNETSKINAIADEETEIFFVPIDKLGFLVKEHPEWLNYIFRIYHQRFEELLDVINAIAFKKLDERLLDLLETKCDISKSKTLNITHEQVANELGTSRVVVSRLLKRMEEENLVKLGRNNIELL